MYFNALQQQNFTDENLALHVIIAVHLNIEFYRLFNWSSGP